MKICPECDRRDLADDIVRCDCGWQFQGSDRDPMALPDGTPLKGGEIEIARYLGRGGFAMAYEARYREFPNRNVVVKELFVGDNRLCFRIPGQTVITSSGQEESLEKLKKRFREEAGRLFDLHHPGLVNVLSRFSENGTEYLVMRYIEGVTLERWLSDRSGPLKAEQAWKLLESLLDAVDYLHEEGLVHRDINPRNIMVERTRRGEERPVLIDFGLARELEEATRSTSHTAFTDGYAPLEQYDNSSKPTPTLDLYSLGAVLHFLITGEAPPSALQRQRNRASLRWPKGVPKKIRDRVEHAMALDVTERPQGIKKWRSGADSSAPSVATSTKAGRSVESSPIGGVGINEKDWARIPASGLVYALPILFK